MGRPLDAELLSLIGLFYALNGALGCGTDPDPLVDAGEACDAELWPERAGCGPPRTAVVVASDYVTGGTALVDLDSRTAVPDVLTIHSDAVVRCPCGRVVVIERMHGDNLSLFDPAGGRLDRVAQVPLGRLSNPQDAAFRWPLAYVTLHETDQVAAVDLRCGQVVDWLDLSPLADADGQAEPAAIHEFEGLLFVVVQRLDRDTALMDPAGPAAIAVLGTVPRLALTDTIELEGSNPYTRLVADPSEPGVVYVGHIGLQSDPVDGGVERVDLVARASRGFVVGGAELGGNVNDLAIVRDDLAYAAISTAGADDRLVAFDPAAGEVLDTVASGPTWSLVRVVFDETRRQLLVASADRARPGVRVFDADDGAELTAEPIPTGLPPFDLCLVPDQGGDGDADADVDADADADESPPDCGFPWEGDAGVEDPFADEVVSFEPVAAGAGADEMPGIVLGPPEGAGAGAGGADTVSLGCGGAITLRFDPPAIVDGPGPDLIVFENAFVVSGGGIFADPAQVEVSADGEVFVAFACDPETLAGCAGQAPVRSNTESCVDPTDPALAGGDAYDLADVGLATAAWVRIVDRSAENEDASRWCSAPNAGFDLDAVAARHAP